MEQVTTCQVCGREVKASKGVIAHHGYKRPYQCGQQTASCDGARYVPYEVSCERLREVVGMVERFIEHHEKQLAAFVANPPKTLTVHEYREVRTYEKPETINPYRKSIPRTYECAYARQQEDMEREIRLAKMDLDQMTRRLNEWKPAEDGQPSYQDNAGYVEHGTFNASDIVIYRAAEADIDVGKNRYAVVCEKHYTLVGSSTLKLSQAAMRYPDFCEDCMATK